MSVLDTRPWNLWAAATVLACGPGKPEVEEANGTDGASETGEASGTGDQECHYVDDCGLGQYCDYGVCKPGCWNEYYCPECYSHEDCSEGQICSSGYCYDGECYSEEDCSEGQICYDYVCSECYEHEHCASDEFCNDHSCEAVASIPECDLPIGFEAIPLPDDLDVLPTSLHFAGPTAPSARDLVIGHSAGITVVRLDGSWTEVPLDAAPVAIAVGDMNGDGEEDLVVNRMDDLAQVLLADEFAGFVPQLTVVSSVLRRMVATGDFNQDWN